MSRVVAIAALAAVLGGGVGFVILSKEEPVTPDQEAARRACGRAERFGGIVERNGPAADARAELTRAIVEATKAVELDARWVPLQSGLETIEVALENDDAGAANVGLRVVRANCEAAEAAD